MWSTAQVDCELSAWRAERELLATHRHETAEHEAGIREAARGLRPGQGTCPSCAVPLYGPAHDRRCAVCYARWTTCQRCSAATRQRRSGLCAICSRAAYWRTRTTVHTYEARLGACETTEHEIACRRCGVVELIHRRCGARMLCSTCAHATASHTRRRLVVSLGAQMRAHARAAQGRGARVTPAQLAMVTLTIRHSGDLTADRALLSAAWNRWRTWYAQRYGRRLTYAWTVEITDGTDGLGHVHLHVITPHLPFRRYQDLYSAWQRATHGATEHIHVSRRRRRSVSRAAGELAKYAAKGCAQLSTPSLAARWIRAQHTRRMVSTSRGFWCALPCAHELRLISDARKNSGAREQGSDRTITSTPTAGGRPPPESRPP